MNRLPEPTRHRRAFDVVGLGENSMDELAVVDGFPEPGGKVRIVHRELQGGGQIATAMVACQRLGLKTRYLGKVGDDDFGRRSRASLDEEGIDTSAMRVEAGVPSRCAFIIIERDSGNRTVLFEQDGRLAFRADELTPELVTDSALLHVDATDLGASIKVAQFAKRAGVPILIDVDEVKPGVEELVALADICVVPYAFACAFTRCDSTEAVLGALAARTAGFVCVTRGDEGCAALLEGVVLELPAFRVQAIDTTACGDVFHAAFAKAWLDGKRPAEILQYAQAAAALNTRALGARGGIPSRAEVDAFLESRVR